FMRFEITPADGPVDGELHVRVVEANPRGRVTISVSTEDGDGRPWTASAQFLAGEDGVVDLARDAPVQGSYNMLDPMALVTSMAPVGKEPTSVLATLDAGDLQF